MIKPKTTSNRLLHHNHTLIFLISSCKLLKGMLKSPFPWRQEGHVWLKWPLSLIIMWCKYYYSHSLDEEADWKADDLGQVLELAGKALDLKLRATWLKNSGPSHRYPYSLLGFLTVSVTPHPSILLWSLTSIRLQLSHVLQPVLWPDQLFLHQARKLTGHLFSSWSFINQAFFFLPSKIILNSEWSPLLGILPQLIPRPLSWG